MTNETRAKVREALEYARNYTESTGVELRCNEALALLDAEEPSEDAREFAEVLFTGTIPSFESHTVKSAAQLIAARDARRDEALVERIVDGIKAARIDWIADSGDDMVIAAIREAARRGA
jgi:hypothetical protein